MARTRSAWGEWWKRRFPNLFYGWLVVLACGVATLCACPAQSYGIAQFTEYYVNDAGVSRTALSTIWAVVLFTCSLLLPLFGQIADRIGTRRLLSYVILPYVALLVCLGRVQGWVSFAAVFFGARLVGPGVLVLIGSTTANRWFERRRGKATAVLNLLIGLETLFPSISLLLVQIAGNWRDALALLAGLTGLALLLVWAVLRDRPYELGMSPDGDKLALAKDGLGVPLEEDAGEEVGRGRGQGGDDMELRVLGSGSARIAADDDANVEETALLADDDEERHALVMGATTHAVSDAPLSSLPGTADGQGDGALQDDERGGSEETGVTLREAMRFGMFWACLLALGMSALFWTGVNLHSVSIFASKGIEAKHVATSFAVATAVAMVVAFSTGFVLDHTSRKERVFALSLLFGGISCVILLRMTTVTGSIVFGLSYGLFVGTSHAGWMVVFAAFFGRRHLGSINGVVTAVAQIVGGIGPLTFSLVHDFRDSYNDVFISIGTGMLVVCAVLTLIPFSKPVL